MRLQQYYDLCSRALLAFLSCMTGQEQDRCHILQAAHVAHGIAADGVPTRLTLGRRRRSTPSDTSWTSRLGTKSARCTDAQLTARAYGVLVASYYYYYYVSPCSRWSIFTAHHPRPPTCFSHARDRFDGDYLVGGIHLAVPHGRLH
jgi:hypothetical protein